MAKRQTWLEQLNRYILPLVVVGIGLYGMWDLTILPLLKVEQPVQACTTQVVDVAMLKPAATPDQPAKRIQAPEGLPIVVPAGEKRLISVTVSNPERLPVMYQWQTTHGQMSSRITTENQAAYTAPRSLVDDTITVESTLQGCSPMKRTINVAIVPSAKVRIPDQPTPEMPTLPSPTPSMPSSLPTVAP